MQIERELMRGAGPVAVMKCLEHGEKYGYELIQRLSQSTDGVLAMGQSTLYPMLYNLEAKGFLQSRVELKEGQRRRKYYSLTDKGTKRLAHDTAQWRAVLNAMSALGVTAQTAC